MMRKNKKKRMKWRSKKINLFLNLRKLISIQNLNKKIKNMFLTKKQKKKQKMMKRTMKNICNCQILKSKYLYI